MTKQSYFQRKIQPKTSWPQLPWHNDHGDLHILRQTETTSVYIELGNIRNQLDQDRFTLENNRQALANWLCEGLMEACSE